MTMQCNDAQPLIPSYLDGELSEAQAAPLRRHLLDCQPCRAGAQSEKSLKRWFAQEEPVAIPAGFAARVARRAFAGDTGSEETARSWGTGALGESDGDEQGKILKFVLRITAVAAVLLIFLSIGLRNATLPSGRGLMADDRPEVSLEEALRELDRLDRTEPKPKPEEVGASQSSQGATAVEDDRR